MYKLMIVDDEKNIREGMAKGIPWSDWGFEVFKTASNGVEAVKIIESGELPDVVLSDIRMPQMDGVELMQYLNKNYPEIKIIILSGYNDFEYLNYSIKNNVTEYLLKPTDIDEFEETFKKMKTKLDDERKMKERNEKNEGYYLNTLLNVLIKGFGDDEILDSAKEILKKYDFSEENCVIASMYIDDSFNDKRSLFQSIKKLIEFCNSYENEFKLKYYFFRDMRDEMAVIISSKDEELSDKVIIDFFDKIIKIVKDEFGLSIYGGVSELCIDLQMLPQSYEQAVTVLRQSIFSDKNPVEFYRSVTKNEVEYRDVAFNYENIVNDIIRGDSKGIENEINRVFSFFESGSVKDYTYMSNTCLELMFYLSRWSMKYNLNFEKIMDGIGVKYDDIHRIISFERKRDTILNVINALINEFSVGMQRNGKNNNLAQMIKDCVDNEYMENYISLEYVADKAKKSAAYISKLFKEEFGANFSEYITTKRLEKSKELLVDPSMKIYEIAQKTGYADVSNFIKVFKKKYGISPGDYRNFILK